MTEPSEELKEPRNFSRRCPFIRELGHDTEQRMDVLLPRKNRKKTTKEKMSDQKHYLSQAKG